MLAQELIKEYFTFYRFGRFQSCGIIVIFYYNSIDNILKDSNSLS